MYRCEYLSVTLKRAAAQGLKPTLLQLFNLLPHQPKTPGEKNPTDILYLYRLSRTGSWSAGVHPSCQRVRGRIHPGQDAGLTLMYPSQMPAVSLFSTNHSSSVFWFILSQHSSTLFLKKQAAAFRKEACTALHLAWLPLLLVG